MRCAFAENERWGQFRPGRPAVFRTARQSPRRTSFPLPARASPSRTRDRLPTCPQIQVFLPKTADKLIVISSYLESKYKRVNSSIVVLPPLIDEERYKNLVFTKENSDDVINFIYVGFPFATDGRKVSRNSFKDRLDLAIESLYELRDMNFIFTIYGITKEQYLNVLPEHTDLLSKMVGKILFLGKIDNDAAIEAIAKADFTILLRDVNEMTTAGFPTKVVESITCGTPVITTKTSDLDQYIRDGRNGFFVSFSQLKTDLYNILMLNTAEKCNMKIYCRENMIFSYKNFRERISHFFST